MAKVGGLSDVDPRLSHDAGAPISSTQTRPQHRALYNSTVSFEEYMYYAERTKADQDADTKAGANNGKLPLLKVLFPPKSNNVELDHKMANLNTSIASQRAIVTNE